jgi:2-dehydro-3-deoxy-D-arabinonate dehydratase
MSDQTKALRLYRTTEGIVIEQDGLFYLSQQTDWSSYINRNNLYQEVEQEVGTLTADNDISSRLHQSLLPPVDRQEVWAAGVTYLRSRDARMEEAKESGGDTFYDKVYEAERPELFFKSTAARVVGHNQPVRIRKDSTWNVPEPELALYITASGDIAGYSIGNDMSSRSIEGENPLYLPQAKVYDGAAALGPCLYVPASPIPPSTKIRIEIKRGAELMYSDETPISQMKRSHTELVSFLYRELSFPEGCFLMTGTCLVPSSDFTLQPGDMVTITIEGIGTLQNIVA